MTPSRMLRPVLVCLILSGVGVSTASCGGDPHRFEAMARNVADIPLEDAATGHAKPSQDAAPVSSAQAQGLRPALAATPNAHSGLQVEVMDPHALWDARDADLRGRVGQFAQDRLAPAMIEAAAPAMAGAVVRAVSDRMDRAEGLRPAIARTDTRPVLAAHTPPAPAAAKPPVRAATTPSRSTQVRNTIQLGAYSSEQAARSAWTTVSTGAARAALHGLTPVFERVMVNGRPFTRLKVAAPTTAAVAICRAADVRDPWCARSA